MLVYEQNNPAAGCLNGFLIMMIIFATAALAILLVGCASDPEVVDDCPREEAVRIMQATVAASTHSPSSVIFIEEFGMQRPAVPCEHAVGGIFRTTNLMGGPVDHEFHGYVKKVDGEWVVENFFIL